jgi:hypothetical protein
VTVDEELNKLEDDIRRLKIEYEIFFNGSCPRPPHDTLFRVENTIKRYSSDQSKLNFGQRYRFTNLLQKYAVNAQLWRRKMQEKEEGRSLAGMPRRPVELPASDGPVRVVCSDPDVETEKVNRLLQAVNEARRQAGEKSIDPAFFHQLVKDRTNQTKGTHGCDKVQVSVSVEEGKVKLKFTKAE